MIILNKVLKKYDSRKILNKVNLKIEYPGIYLIKGNNGEGKTTLLNVIGGFVKYKGKIINDHKDNMAYLFQNSYLIEHLTVKEHLDMFKIDYNILKIFNLFDKLNERPIKLSNGQRQRIGVILALYSNREVVLLDEPFSNLDKSNFKIILKELIKKKKDKIIFIISHDNDIDRWCDGIFKVRNGQVEIIKLLKSKNKIRISNQKHRIKMKDTKKNFKFYKKYYLKIYVLIFISLGLLMFINIGESVLYRKLNEDINNSVDYFKFYLKKCSFINNNGFEISKCSNPSLEDIDKLKKEGINISYNYDLLINYLYSREDLSLISNQDIKLKKGVYPSNYNQVIVSDKYKLGDLISLDSDILINGKNKDIYKRSIVLEVVGIYENLNFYNDDKIYLDYSLIEEFLKKEVLTNNQISLYDYYHLLDIDNFKYVSFSKSEIRDFVFQGEKYDYYQSLSDLLVKISELFNILKVLIVFAGCYFLFRLYRLLMVDKQESISFLLANSYDYKSILITDFLFVFIEIFIFLLINSLFYWMGLIREIIDFIIALVCYISIIVFLEFFYVNRKKVSKRMVEQVW